MPAQIVRQITPEEEELRRKREELAAVRNELAERETELAELLAKLKGFEGQYLRQVGSLYAELDEWDARVAELEAKVEKSSTARERAERLRKQADETHEATHGEASKAAEFKPSGSLKSLYRKVALKVHPDMAKDDADAQRRSQLFMRAKDAFDRGDAETLQQILDEGNELSDSVQGEGIGAELVRIIRLIAKARQQVAAIGLKVDQLKASKLAKLMQEVDEAKANGRDFLAELARNLSDQVARARREYETLAQEVASRAR